MKGGPSLKINNVDEDCFVSPVVITVKNEGLVKTALESRKLNVSCMKRRSHMSNMETSERDRAERDGRSLPIRTDLEK